MAAGRGEFLPSFLEGLRRNRNPNCGLAAPARRQPKAGGNVRSWPETTVNKYEADSPQKITSQSEENVMENLPSEILLKVLSYLDVSSLSCISHVSRTFHRLADDNVLWQKIYISDFGSRTWRPKSVASDAALQVDQDQHQDQDQDQDQDQEDRAAGYWKKMYFRTVAGQDVNNWKRERRDISPLTGLPLRTRWALRNLNVSWELMLCGEPGQKITMQPSRVDFFESSAVLHFSGAHFPRYHRIRSILLHGVRKEAQRSPRAGRPGWRSLILKLEVKNRPSWFFGKDNLVRLRHFLPGVTIGTWRCEDTVVFIMVTLHFHKLVERSLLGSPVCPYSEPVDLPPADHSDPVFGLHGYTLHFVLHDNANKIMSGTFSQLSCRTVPVQGGLVELRVIDRYNLSQHRSLSGGIKLPWSTDTLEGSVENCCIMTLTLLDDFQKPFWSVSSSVFVVPATRPLSPDYVGEHFLLHFRDPEGQLRMELVRLTEQRQFLVIGLVVNLPVLKVNKRFGRAY